MKITKTINGMKEWPIELSELEELLIENKSAFPFISMIANSGTIKQTHSGFFIGEYDNKKYYTSPIEVLYIKVDFAKEYHDHRELISVTIRTDGNTEILLQFHHNKLICFN